MKSYVYKTVGSLEISLDVYLPSAPAPAKAGKGEKLPVLLWFHGGGLLMSDRGNVAPHSKRCADKHGLCYVSADYRLAPQASLVEIVQDVRDAAIWCRTVLPGLVAASGLGYEIDAIDKLFVGGASAGGYLSLLAGLPIAGIVPAPRGIIAIYPITNAQGPFFTTQQHPVSYVTDKRVIPHEEMARHIDPTAAAIAAHVAPGPVPPRGNRTYLYTYMIQEANLHELLFRNAPAGTDIASYVPEKSVTAAYPPTYIFHGEIDDKVGIEQARSVVAAMRVAGVAGLEYEEVLIEKGKEQAAQHGFDYKEGEDFAQIYAFIQSKL